MGKAAYFESNISIIFLFGEKYFLKTFFSNKILMEVLKIYTEVSEI